MANKLSHSSTSRHEICPESYNLYYNKRIRSTKLRGALLFGKALDSAINQLLKPETPQTPEEVFDFAFRFQEISKKQQYLPDYTKIIYSKYDFDRDLVEESDLTSFEITLDQIYQVVKARDQKENPLTFDKMNEDQKRIVNIASWISLHKKGYYLIDAFRTKVLPRIAKLHSVQEPIEIKNEDGDLLTGIIDLVADLKGYNFPIVLDIKTSAMAYKADSVVNSPQLALYTHAVGEKYKTNVAGFIVLNKQLKKNRIKTCTKCGHKSSGRAQTCDNVANKIRCNSTWTETINPEVYVQMIINEIPQELEDKVFDNIEKINDNIKSGVFVKNLASCDNIFGSPCEYRDLCFGGKMDNLEIV